MATHPPVSPNPLSLHLDTLQAVHLGPSGSVKSSPFLSPSNNFPPKPPQTFHRSRPPSNAVLRENNVPFTTHHTSLSSNHHHWSSLWQHGSKEHVLWNCPAQFQVPNKPDNLVECELGWPLSRNQTQVVQHMAKVRAKVLRIRWDSTDQGGGDLIT